MLIQMPGRTRVAALATATIVSVAGTMAGCSNDRTTSPTSDSPSPFPASRTPTSLAFDGGGQIVLAGGLFSSPVAIVLDAAGEGVPGVNVTFTVTGSGSVQPTTSLTDGAGRASTDWFSGTGENNVTASAPGLTSVTITSHGIDSSAAASYELVDVEPSYVVGLAGRMLLSNGLFYTTVRCQPPATCIASGYGTYGISGSSLSLDYQNQFLQYWNEFSDNRELGSIRGDTLEVNQTDSMWQPYTFRLRFVFRGGTRQ
jgi:hypothetical protein